MTFYRNQYDAVSLALDEIGKIQPNKLLPKWFGPSTYKEFSLIAHNIWKIKFHLFTKHVLKEGEQWHTFPNGKRVVRGTDGLLIIRHSDEELIPRLRLAFEVDVDLNIRKCVFISKMDLTSLKLEDFDIKY